MARAFRHLTYIDRLRIEVLRKEKYKPLQLASIIGCSLATIYRELKRGAYVGYGKDLIFQSMYSADVSQNLYNYNATAKGQDLKIGNDYSFVSYVEHKILIEKYSPDAVIGEIRLWGLSFQTNICTRTLYRYIDMGIFPNLTNKNLLIKSSRKRPYRHISKAPIKNPHGTSIEKRPIDILLRKDFGHWEMDTVVGKAAGKSTSLLVLTERKTRYELILKIQTKTLDCVVKSLDKLERKYKSNFSNIFKTITVDNGCEFLNYAALEQSSLYKNKKRTQIYYCHPYSSWERGTNENTNKMIRRFIPKGTPIDKISPNQIKNIENWINNYPRRIHNYQCAATLFNQNVELYLNA